MCSSREQDSTRKERVAELPCGDIMTLTIKVYFILPQTQAKIQFISVLRRKTSAWAMRVASRERVGA